VVIVNAMTLNPPNRGRKSTLTIRLTPAERDEIKAAAQARDIPTERFARNLLLRTVRNPFAATEPRR
jgi:hypothetical protein